jgi:hypothetical protein
VVSWELNQHEGQVYAISASKYTTLLPTSPPPYLNSSFSPFHKINILSANWLYEIDHEDVEQNNVHHFNSPAYFQGINTLPPTPPLLIQPHTHTPPPHYMNIYSPNICTILSIVILCSLFSYQIFTSPHQSNHDGGYFSHTIYKSI